MGVIVAAAMMGGLALMLAQMTKQQAVTQRKAETGLDMNQLHHRILGVLYDGDACLKTLTEGTDSVHNGRTLQKLLNKGGKTVVERGQDINRTVRVEKMVIQGIPSPRTGQTEEGHLIITIKKLGVANEGMGDIIKKFPLTLELESASSNKLVRCHHTLDSKEHAIHTNICKSLGGEMESRGSPTTECTLTNVYKTFCESLGGVYSNPAVGTPTGQCNIKDTYVDTAGDTMTGALTAPDGSKLGGCSESGGSWSCPQNLSAGATVNAANVSASGTVSAGGAGSSGGGSGNGVTDPTRVIGSTGDSSSLNISCPSGEVMTGISNGSPSCISLSDSKGGGTIPKNFYDGKRGTIIILPNRVCKKTINVNYRWAKRKEFASWKQLNEECNHYGGSMTCDRKTVKCYMESSACYGGECGDHGGYDEARLTAVCQCR